MVIHTSREPFGQRSLRSSPWSFPKLSASPRILCRTCDLAKAFADLPKPGEQDREGIEGLLRKAVHVPDFIVRLRLIPVRLAQARSSFHSRTIAMFPESSQTYDSCASYLPSCWDWRRLFPSSDAVLLVDPTLRSPGSQETDTSVWSESQPSPIPQNTSIRSSHRVMESSKPVPTRHTQARFF